jgi:hypothetical protein
MTVFGSIADSAGDVPANLPIEAYIGDRLCGRGSTQRTGDAPGQVTVYFADVVSREQTAGCGSDGDEVRIKVGDRFAPQTARWRAGPVQLHLTFGTATPAPIPTFTPTPRRASPSPVETITPVPTRPPATPQQPTPGASASPSATVTATGSASPSVSPGSSTPTLNPTRPGGLRIQDPRPGDPAGDGGFPVWGLVLIGAGVLCLAGGLVGILLARRNADADE